MRQHVSTAHVTNIQNVLPSPAQHLILPLYAVQPLAGNGLPAAAGRVLLVDNEARKAAPGEEDCCVVIPTWEHSAGELAAHALTRSCWAGSAWWLDVQCCTH